MNDQTLPAIVPPPQRVLAIAQRGMFSDPDKFAFAQRVAKMFAASSLVPAHMQGEEHVCDCMIALNIADRLGEDPMTVMQNIIVVKGRPGWFTSYMIARANRSEVFHGRINWRVSHDKDRGMIVTAYAALADTGEVAEVSVDMAMANAEGWTNNSKYKTMPEHMLRWRSAAMLIRLFCPEVMLGFQTAEELETEASMKDVSLGRGNVAPPVQVPPSSHPQQGSGAAVAEIMDGRVPEPTPPPTRSGYTRGHTQAQAQARSIPGVKEAPPKVEATTLPAEPVKPASSQPPQQETDPDAAVLAEVQQFEVMAAKATTFDELEQSRLKFADSYNTRWGQAARVKAENAYHDAEKRVATAKAAPKQVEPPKPKVTPEEARQKGAMARANSMSSKAVPKTYDEELTKAWLEGFNEEGQGN